MSKKRNQDKNKLYRLVLFLGSLTALLIIALAGLYIRNENRLTGVQSKMSEYLKK